MHSSLCVPGRKSRGFPHRHYHDAGLCMLPLKKYYCWVCIIGSAEALPILCVRYFRCEREREREIQRERERERERDGSDASYIVREVLSVRERDTERERERERERDGSDVTIVALKLAMNSHFPLPKIRTIGDELTLSLAKNSHFSFLPSHFPHHCGAEIRNEFTLSIAKNFFALFVPPLSNGTSRATNDRKPKTNETEDKWSNPARSYFALPIEKMNQINTKNYWK